jgi:hypothetical protein
MGGPRDTLPPRLVSVNPPASARHFHASKIVFNFNEYIESKDVRDNLIVAPVPKVDPIVDSKLRTLTVRLKDSLQPNTTYVLDFGKSIRDVNEGNILKNFTYVFTTGDYIDSAELSGKVILAATGKVDSSLVVLLHQNLDDSAVVKDRPRYIARLDTTGQFLFRYLHPGTYALYAMKDEGGTHKYLSKSQLFAFADSPVVVGKKYNPITLYAYAEEAAGSKSYGKGGKTSSGGNKVGAKAPEKGSKEKEKDRRLQFHTTVSNGELDVLGTLDLVFANPLQVFDSSKIRLTDEKYADINRSKYHFIPDSTNKTFTMTYSWPTDTKFHLILDKDFAQDSSGRKLLKTDTISFHTKKEEEYGEVRIRFTKLDLSKNPVLQFVQGDAVKFSYPFTTGFEYKTRLFLPGEYELRVLYDTNKNGVWDPGEFFSKPRQPEIVVPIRRKFTVKANWDNDLDITL